MPPPASPGQVLGGLQRGEVGLGQMLSGMYVGLDGGFDYGEGLQESICTYRVLCLSLSFSSLLVLPFLAPSRHSLISPFTPSLFLPPRWRRRTAESRILPRPHGTTGRGPRLWQKRKQKCRQERKANNDRKGARMGGGNEGGQTQARGI